jgi:DNA-binding transcriptional MerR regulator
VEQDIVEGVHRTLEGIPKKSYYRIGEVAKITGVKPYVLRYWETEFRPVLPPKSKSGQRMYRRREIEAILLVKKLLYKQRFTIAGARRRLRELLRRGKDTPVVADPLDPRVLLRMKRELEEVRGILSDA